MKNIFILFLAAMLLVVPVTAKAFQSAEDARVQPIAIASVVAPVVASHVPVHDSSAEIAKINKRLNELENLAKEVRDPKSGLRATTAAHNRLHDRFENYSAQQAEKIAILSEQAAKATTTAADAGGLAKKAFQNSTSAMKTAAEAKKDVVGVQSRLSTVSGVFGILCVILFIGVIAAIGIAIARTNARS